MRSTYQNAKHIRCDKCVSNAIRSAVVREILLDVIRSTVIYVRNNESEFLQRVRELSTVQQNEAAKSHKKELAKNERRLNELKMIFKRTYEDNIIGNLSDETYSELSAEYERERAELNAHNSKMQAEFDAFENDGTRAEKFLELARKFTEFAELTPAMLNEFVGRVVVYPTDKTSLERTRLIDVELNYIGRFDVPIIPREPTEEEQTARVKRLESAERKRQRDREYYYKCKAAA